MLKLYDLNSIDIAAWQVRHEEVVANATGELDFIIVEASSALYLVPDGGNNLLGFVSKDLREWVASDARLQRPHYPLGH